MFSKFGKLLQGETVRLSQCRRFYGQPVLPYDCVQDMTPSSLVIEAEARRFIHDCLRRLNVPFEKLRCVSDIMLAADYRGIHGMGIGRLETYLNDLQYGGVDITAEPEIISQTSVTAQVDGHGAMGVFVGNFCMDLAVEKAIKSGIGFVVAKRSYDIGMASWYAFRAMASGCVGLVLSNSPAMMVAPGCREASIGANCLAFGADGNHSHFMLDMATSVKGMGAVEWANINDERIPVSWAMDESGVPTTFPGVALRANRLNPAGGQNGYCLATMIDLLCGVMSGANYATRLAAMSAEEKKVASSNLGVAMLALDPYVFVPDFGERLDDFKKRIDNSTPVDKSRPVRMAGERERLYMRHVDEMGALSFPNTLLAKFKHIADSLSVQPMQLAFINAKPKYLRF
ncbi:uncharacterized protein LOC111599454 [Drosophila hydei]|uniref:Uncharacterized protein LOC111599454 n=1 Tax=Drosophila hydei TaxID=7224 RepID=A0A6J1LWI8_DROHY|nr:uncharacterized protein LOC111599454 [Drosophila hydei]